MCIPRARTEKGLTTSSPPTTLPLGFRRSWTPSGWLNGNSQSFRLYAFGPSGQWLHSKICHMVTLLLNTRFLKNPRHAGLRKDDQRSSAIHFRKELESEMKFKLAQWSSLLKKGRIYGDVNAHSTGQWQKNWSFLLALLLHLRSG